MADSGSADPSEYSGQLSIGLSLNYFALQYDNNPKHCFLGSQPDDVGDFCHRLIEGTPLAQAIPKSAEFRMSDHIGGVAVSDYINNPFGYTIISERFANLLKELGIAPKTECVSATVINHKGRRVETPYVLMNILGCHDCLDFGKTVGKVDALEPQFFQWIDRLELDPAKLAETDHIFRVQAFPRLLLVSDWLKQQIEAVGLTGIRFVPTGIQYQFT